MTNPQLEAAKTVDEIFERYYGWMSKEQTALEARHDFIRDVVMQLGRLMRPVAEEQVKSSGWLSPDDCREQVERMANARIADYCRHRRLAIEQAQMTIDLGPMLGIRLVLALDEAHHARLANLPTKAEEQQAFDNTSRFAGEPVEHRHMNHLRQTIDRYTTGEHEVPDKTEARELP